MLARRKKHPVRRVMSLLIAAALGACAWLYLKPFLVTATTMRYESYTVGTGDIRTTKSFSATLSEADSETHYNDTHAESVRKLYVSGGQMVKKGDLLMELSDGTVLEAGMDGMVNEIRYSEGDWLRSGVQLVEICDLEHLKASLQIDEYDVDQVSVGQKCVMTIVPLDVSFETELSHVSRLSSGTGRVAYYSATAEIAAPENVLPGMTTSVTLPDQEALGVVTLDMAALSFDEDRKPYVLTRTAEGYERISVETGLSDGMQVEIVSGLAPGDTVWKEAGLEEVEQSFSLAEAYKRIFGETVVINEERGSNAGRVAGRGGNAGEGWPEGMSFPGGLEQPEGTAAFPGGEFPAGMASATDMGFPGNMPEGMSFPEGFEPPEGMEQPEGMTMPQGGQRPGNNDSDRPGRTGT